MTNDRPPNRFPPQKCGLCGAILVPVPTPEGDGFDLLCGNPKCPRSREEIEEEEETSCSQRHGHIPAGTVFAPAAASRGTT